MAPSIWSQEYFFDGLTNPQPPPKGLEDTPAIHIRLGGQVRFIPTRERRWDFGMRKNISDELIQSEIPRKNLPPLAFILRNYPHLDPRMHLTEAGIASQEYLRAEARINIEVHPENNLWNLFFSLECDSILDGGETDQRCAHFGLERLNAMMRIPALRSELHAGWDFYVTDAIVINDPTLSISGPLSIYADDDPGIWFKGGWGLLSWQTGWHKKVELNRIIHDPNSELLTHYSEAEAANRDRDIYDMVVDYNPVPNHLLKFILVEDQFRYPSDENQRILSEFTHDDPRESVAANPQKAKVSSRYLGLLYHGLFSNNIFQVTSQYVQQSGSAQNTEIFPKNSSRDDYRIAAHMMYVNLTSAWSGSGATRGRVGLSYLNTSGDGKDDSTLEGYTGVGASQQFSQQIGSANSILSGQHPLTLGTELYGVIPEYYGSHGKLGESGIPTGGLQGGNPQGGAHLAGGRGDNPGLTLWNINLGNRFHENWVYQTQYRWISYNQRFFPYLTEGDRGHSLSPLHIGSEWINEVYYILNWNTLIQLAYTQFFQDMG